MLMPKPWVGGGWVRADQGSQGSTSQRPPNFSPPTLKIGKVLTHCRNMIFLARELVTPDLSNPAVLGKRAGNP